MRRKYDGNGRKTKVQLIEELQVSAEKVNAKEKKAGAV
jgi:hypothetical protein